jgi:hypothetical protein
MNRSVPKTKGIDFLRNKGKCLSGISMFQKQRESTFSRTRVNVLARNLSANFMKFLIPLHWIPKNTYNTSFAANANKAHQQASNQITEILQ